MNKLDELEFRCALAGSPRAEQLIACLEAEVKDRDARIVELGRRYDHGSPLHKAVFMSLESWTGSDTFEDGVRATIADRDQLRAELAAISAQEPVGFADVTLRSCAKYKSKLHCLPLYAAPVAKQDNAAKMPCGAAVSNVYEAYEAGLAAKQVVMPDLSGLIRVEATIQESGDGVSDCPGSMDGETNACFYFTGSGQLIHCAAIPESSLSAADQEGGQDE